jgi:hypothetical protein
LHLHFERLLWGPGLTGCWCFCCDSQAIWDAVGDHALVGSAMREQCLETVVHKAQREKEIAEQATRDALDKLAQLQRQLDDARIENLLLQGKLSATQAELRIARANREEYVCGDTRIIDNYM